jgi:hypothetical protein
MRRAVTALAAGIFAAAAAVAVACGFGNDYKGGPDVDAAQVSFVDERGATLVSADGLFTVRVPAGAITRDGGAILYISGPSSAPGVQNAVGPSYELQPYMRFSLPTLVSLKSAITPTDFEELGLENLDTFEPRVGGAVPADPDTMTYFAFTTTTGRISLVRSLPVGSSSATPACVAKCCSGGELTSAPCTCRPGPGSIEEEAFCLGACFARSADVAGCIVDGGSSGFVVCGGAPCPLLSSGAFCCVAPDASACVLGGGPVRCEGTTLACDGPDDCADGGVCCLDASSRAAACTPACAPACTLQNPQGLSGVSACQ